MPPEDQNRDDMAKTTNEQLKEKDAEIAVSARLFELEKLRSKAFSTMIDLAEETLQYSCEKKIWYQTVAIRTECQSQGLGTLCGLFGFTRQAYNKRNVSLTALLKRPLSLSSLKRHVSIVSRILA